MLGEKSSRVSPQKPSERQDSTPDAPEPADVENGLDDHSWGRWALIVAGVLAVLAIVSATVASEAVPISCALCHASTRGDEAHTGISCWACHTDGTSASRIVRPVRISGMMASLAGLGQRPLSPLADSACLHCHADVLTRTVSSHGIRIRHVDCSDTGHCASCHGIHSPALGRPVLDRCAKCHNEDREETACPTCHEGPVPKITSATGWLALAHRKTDSDHGVGGTTSCVVCHRSAECRACHGVRLPHGDLGAWRAAHGSDAGASRAECLRCHESNECESCHRIEMPHPKGFLARHSTEVSDRGERLCMSCHLDDDCLRCHMGHIHAHRISPGMRR